MEDRKRREIEEQLQMIEKRLANAQEYLARNVNVEGLSLLHLGDWQGKSGHPLWMRNHMIPAVMRGRARKERTLRTLDNKAKDKEVTRRRRSGKPARLLFSDAQPA